MSSLNKEEIATAAREFFKENLPGYPNIELEEGMKLLPGLYGHLIKKELIKSENIPYNIFEAVAIDKFQEIKINERLNDFIRGF